MTFFIHHCRRWLEADGYVVYAPDEPQPLPIPNLASAIAFVRASGHAVIKAHVPQLPRNGECWTPKRGQGVAKDRPLAEPRWVRSVGQDAMSYALSRDGWPVKIDMASWHRWVRKTRAVVS